MTVMPYSEVLGISAVLLMNSRSKLLNTHKGLLEMTRPQLTVIVSYLGGMMNVASSTYSPPRLYIAATSLGASRWLHRTNF